MQAAEPVVRLSDIDEQRFGIRIAKVFISNPKHVLPVMRFCKLHEVRMLIARCPAELPQIAQALERKGCILTDVLVYYARSLNKSAFPNDESSVFIRPARPEEAEAVAHVAAESFQGYFGHYHADSRLGRRECDQVYVDWARRSCTHRGKTDEVLIAESEGELLGFATLRMNDPVEGEGVLFGVIPKAQGRGIYRSFMIQGMEWCLAQGACRMVVSTQIVNVPVQKVWARVGFEADHSMLTFHRWFSPQE